MARKRKLLVPEAREALNKLMQEVKDQKVAPAVPKPAATAAANLIAGNPKPPIPRGSMVEKMVSLAHQQLQDQQQKENRT